MRGQFGSGVRERERESETRPSHTGDCTLLLLFHAPSKARQKGGPLRARGFNRPPNAQDKTKAVGSLPTAVHSAKFVLNTGVRTAPGCAACGCSYRHRCRGCMGTATSGQRLLQQLVRLESPATYAKPMCLHASCLKDVWNISCDYF